MQAGDARPEVAPNRPAVQLLHTAAPPVLYVPGAHAAAVALVDPGTHAKPGAHVPEHRALLCAAEAPYSPGPHREQLDAPLPL